MCFSQPFGGFFIIFYPVLFFFNFETIRVSLSCLMLSYPFSSSYFGLYNLVMEAAVGGLPAHLPPGLGVMCLTSLYGGGFFSPLAKAFRLTQPKLTPGNFLGSKGSMYGIETIQSVFGWHKIMG